MHVLSPGYRLPDRYSVIFHATNLNEDVRAPFYSETEDAGMEILVTC